MEEIYFGVRFEHSEKYGETLIIGRATILERRAEHFDAVLNCPSSINNEAIQHLRQVLINQDLNAPPTVKETQKAISRLSNGKASGIDAISAEV